MYSESSDDSLDVAEETHVEKLSSYSLCVHTSLPDSNTDSDDDFANVFPTFNKDPISKGAFLKKSISESSPSVIANIGLHDDTSNASSNVEVCTTINIGISEENNNEHYSNLDFVQSSQEQIKPISSSEVNTCETESIKTVIEPLSVHTNNSDCTRNTESNILNEEIKKEALQICTLLPKCTYECAFAALYKNRNKKNHTELGLSDLLSKKRLPSRVPNRNQVTNNNTVKYKKMFLQDKKEIKYTEQSNIENSSCDNDVIIITDNSSNDSLSLQDASNIRNNKSKDSLLETEYEDNVLLENSVKDNKVLQSTQNGILRPAKLIINNKPSYVDCVTSTNVSILSPSKLTYVTANQYKRSTCTKAPRSLRKYKKGNLRNQSFPLGRNVFVSNPTNYQEEMVHNYMEYLNFMQNIKKQKLSGKYEHVNLNARNEIRKAFLKSQGTDKNSLSCMNAKDVLKTLNINYSNEKSSTENLPQNSLSNQYQAISPVVVTSSGKLSSGTSLTISVPKFTNLHLTKPYICTTGSDYLLSNTDDTTITAGSSKPLTSTGISPIHSTEEVFGGTKRKVLTKKIAQKRKENIEEGNIILRQKYEEMCEKLILSFPDTDKNYIRQVCKREVYKDVDPAIQLKEFKSVQGKEDHSVETNTVKACEKDAYVADEKYTDLLGIFPNADPNYLKKIVARTLDDPDKLESFVLTQLKNPTYPTKEEKLKRITITHQQMQYITKFDVKQFLEIFPDPFTQFENPNRKCTYSSDALEFLKSYFSQFEALTILAEYNQNKHNLSLTACTLENMKPDRKSTYTSLWETNLSEDIPLLQECAFVKHKKQIRKYLDELNEKETKEFEELKKRNELLECQCCYNECMPSKCSTCDDGHIFCNLCIQRGTEINLAQGTTSVSCFINCDGEFTLSTLQKILPPTQFSIFIRKKQEAEVAAATLEGLVSCPFCHFASIPPPEDKIFKCFNPECMKESCRLCKELNHVPLKCYEEKSDRARLFLEEKMTQALVRKCHSCSRPYFKEDGCNKIICTCGTIMCYICDTPIAGYDHFKSTCPLWSDNHVINSATVKAVAKKVVEDIKENDPNVNINADGLLKNLSTASNYGHNEAVLKRVKKVTKSDI